MRRHPSSRQVRQVLSASIMAGLMFCAPVFPAAAQTSSAPADAEIVVHGERRAVCSGLEGQERLDCLNRALAAFAGAPTTDAQRLSPDAVRAPASVGLAHESATRLRMGDAYGQSVRPNRPPRPSVSVRRP